MRARCRSVTDQAASSSCSRAFTSTNTSRRAAAGDDVDLADRALPAPRQDAKALGDQQHRRPAFGRQAGAERDLTLRPRAAAEHRAGARALIGHRRGLGERQRALVDLAARPAGDGGDLADRLLHRHALERLAQQRIEVGCLGRRRLRVGRRNHDDDLAARRAPRRVVARERRRDRRGAPPRRAW